MINLSLAYGFALVLFRAGALCAVAPALGAKTVPARLRLAIALAIAFAAHASTGFFEIEPSSQVLALAAAAARETALGLCAGLAARWALDAAMAAGQLAGTSMGLGYGAILDPNSGADSAVMGEIFSTTALMLAVALGVHREAVAWLCRSLRELPPGAAIPLRDLAAHAASDAINATALAARMAFPFLVAITFGHAALGLLGRTAPQLNLSSIGFSVAILAGGAAVYLFAPSAAALAANAAVTALSRR